MSFPLSPVPSTLTYVKRSPIFSAPELIAVFSYSLRLVLRTKFTSASSTFEVGSHNIFLDVWIPHNLAPIVNSDLSQFFEQCSSHPSLFCSLSLSLMEALPYQLFKLGSLQSRLVVLSMKTSMLVRLMTWNSSSATLSVSLAASLALALPRTPLEPMIPTAVRVCLLVHS